MFAAAHRKYPLRDFPLLEPSDEEMTDELLSRFENMLPEEYRGISKDEERLFERGAPDCYQIPKM